MYTAIAYDGVPSVETSSEISNTDAKSLIFPVFVLLVFFLFLSFLFFSLFLLLEYLIWVDIILDLEKGVPSFPICISIRLRDALSHEARDPGILTCTIVVTRASLFSFPPQLIAFVPYYCLISFDSSEVFTQ